MHIQRRLLPILKEQLFKKKVLILYGPRQAGKTTLVRELIEPFGADALYIDCEAPANNEMLRTRNTITLFSLVHGKKIVVFDEAQTVRGIGSALKTLFDHHPEVQYIATGSSSFDLANVVSEPLTGRSREFTLYPISLDELTQQPFEYEQRLHEYMRFGGYPGVIFKSEDDRIRDLTALASQYLYKNVLALNGVKKPELIVQLLQLLAHQIGNEVSYRELSSTLKISVQTVERYIDLLEKNFVILRIGAFSRNLRNEVVRTKKVYFIDVGLRNALIGAFAPIHVSQRADVGALFENVMIIERIKFLAHTYATPASHYFWRTVDKSEVDYVEQHTNTLRAYERKWDADRSHKLPRAFINQYPDIPVTFVTPRNAYAFVTGTII
jgi:uncharacterized protein